MGFKGIFIARTCFPDEETSNYVRLKYRCENSIGSAVCRCVTGKGREWFILNYTPFGIDPHKFSSFNKMIRVTALALRFVRKLRKCSVEKGPLKSAELNETETWWINCVQKLHFSDVIKAISNVKSNNLQRQLWVLLILMEF